MKLTDFIPQDAKPSFLDLPDNDITIDALEEFGILQDLHKRLIAHKDLSTPFVHFEGVSSVYNIARVIDAVHPELSIVVKTRMLLCFMDATLDANLMHLNLKKTLKDIEDKGGIEKILDDAFETKRKQQNN